MVFSCSQVQASGTNDPPHVSAWKHPVTGIYHFRKGVPKDLRADVGTGDVFKRSLGTRDSEEAKRLHALMAAEVAQQWANLRRRHKALSLPPLAELDDATIKRVGEAYSHRWSQMDHSFASGCFAIRACTFSTNGLSDFNVVACTVSFRVLFITAGKGFQVSY